MPLEIEKKYRLTANQREGVIKRLPEIGAHFERTDHEENTLYDGGDVDFSSSVLRLRRVGERAILTFKRRLPSATDTKHQLEEETVVDNADAMNKILESLGFRPAVVYEKRRDRWLLDQAKIVIDELPFGLFMEIEASEDEIERIERELSMEGLVAEQATYPELARESGIRNDGVIEARFHEAR
ncbi:MAG: class IV adenylate cyclase [Pyrinomonadaceae bacterium]